MIASIAGRLTEAVDIVTFLVTTGREDELPAGERRSSGRCPVAKKLSEIVGASVFVGSHGAFTLGATVVEMPKELRNWVANYDGS